MMCSTQFRDVGAKDVQDRVSALLGRFKFSQPLAFISKMREHRLAISGHVVLQFLLGIELANSGLNVYVSARDMLDLKRYLRADWFLETYHPQVEETSDIHPDMRLQAGLERIIHFVKLDHVTGTFARINLIVVTPQIDQRRPITYLPTTASMTYITADAIHTLFPRLTFAREALVPLQPTNPPPYEVLPRNINLGTLHVAARTHVRKLLQDDLDVRWPTVIPNYLQPSADCGFACAGLWSEVPKSTFIIPFSGTRVPPEMVRWDLLMASQTTWALSGICQQRNCDSRATL